MKVILEFNSVEEAENALNGDKYKGMLDEIWERVFRPNFKHGYNDDLLEGDEAYNIIEKLSEIFLFIVNEQ